MKPATKLNRFRYESDMIKELEPVIIASCHDLGFGIPQVIHEPPVNFFGNDNADMMLLFRDVKRLLFIEYKLNNFQSLCRQIDILYHAIGIINKEQKDNIQVHPRIAYFTGLDYQTEKITRLLIDPYLYQEIAYHKFGTVYWYGYLNGDIYDGKRLTFHHLYKQAVRNVLKLYHTMAFDDVYFLLRCGYRIETAKSYYNQVKKEEQ